MGQVWSANNLYYDEKLRGIGAGVFYDCTSIQNETVLGNGGILASSPVIPGSLILSSAAETYIDDGNGNLVSSVSTHDNGTVNYRTGSWVVPAWHGVGARFASYVAATTPSTFAIPSETVSGTSGSLVYSPIIPGSAVLFNSTETYTDDGLGHLISSVSSHDNGVINYTSGVWSVTTWHGSATRYVSYVASATPSTVNMHWDAILNPTIIGKEKFSAKTSKYFMAEVGTLRDISKLTGIEEYSKYVDLMQLIPEKFRSSAALQQLVYVLGLNVGTWIGSINDLQSIIDKYSVGDDYIQYLADLVGMKFIIASNTTLEDKRRQLLQVVDWYKMKGTYQALKVVGYSVGLNLDFYDMYTKDYINFTRTPWYAGTRGTNPTGLSLDYYKSPHIGIELSLDTIQGTAPNYHLFEGSSTFTTLSQYVELVRPINVVPEYSVLLNPVTTRSAGVCGDQCTVSLGNLATNPSFESFTAWSSPQAGPCTLLLHMDGVDNGTSFPDASPRNNTVSNPGNNTLTKTATKKFGTSSAYFNGTNSSLTVPSDQQLVNGSFETWTGLTDLLTNDSFETWTGLADLTTNGTMETWTGLTDLLTDGELDVWTSPTVLTNWTVFHDAGIDPTLNREATTIKSGTYSAKLSYASGTNQGGIFQSTGTTADRNKYMVVGAWVKCSVIGAARVAFVHNGTGSAFSSTANLTTDWEYLSVVGLVPNDAITRQPRLYFANTGAITCYFDKAICYVQLAPTGWACVGQAVTPCYYWREEGIVKQGTYSVGVAGFGGNQADFYYNIASPATYNGNTIVFSMWVWASAANHIRLQIYSNGSGSGVQNTFSSFHPGDSAWHFLTVTQVLGTGLTTLQFYGTVDSGYTGYFDKAVGYVMHSPDAGGHEWVLSGTAPIVTREEETIKVGTYSAKLVSTGGGSILSQGVPYPTAYRGQILTFGCWVYKIGTTGSTQVYLQDDQGLNVASSNHPGTGWAYLTATGTINVGAGTILMLCYTDSGSTAYFDKAIGYVQLASTGWTLTGTGATVAREEGTVKVGTYSAKLTRNGTDVQLFEDISPTLGVSYWRGRTVTFGCWVWASVANRARITIGNGLGTQNALSSFHSGGSSWEYLSVTTIMTNDSVAVKPTCYIVTGDTAYFDGAFVTDDAVANFNFGSNGTIDAWVNFSDLPTDGTARTICGQCETSNHYWDFSLWNFTGNYYLLLRSVQSGTNLNVSSAIITAPTLNTQYHIELDLSAGYATIRLNGVAVSAATAFSFQKFDSLFYIGCNAGGQFLKGYVDEFNTRKGVSRHTSDFTPMTMAYGNQPTGWTLSGTGGEVDITSSPIYVGSYAAMLTRYGSAYAVLYQDFTNAGGHNLAYWIGRNATFGCWVWASTANRARLELYDGVTATYSSYHPGDFAWHFLTVTTQISQTASNIACFARVDTGDAVAYFDKASVVEGVTAATTIAIPSQSACPTNVTFAAPPGLTFIYGQNMSIIYDSTHKMMGVVSSYNTITGQLVVTVTYVVGSGTYDAWQIIENIRTTTIGPWVTTNVTYDSSYSTGTVSIDHNSTALVGYGTGWSTNLSTGAQIGFGSTSPAAITTWYDIGSVNTDTSITLSSGLVQDEATTGLSGTLAHYPIIGGTLVLSNGTETFVDNGSNVLVSEMSIGHTGTINYTSGAWTVTGWSGGTSKKSTYRVPAYVGTTISAGSPSVYVSAPYYDASKSTSYDLTYDMSLTSFYTNINVWQLGTGNVDVIPTTSMTHLESPVLTNTAGWGSSYTVVSSPITVNIQNTYVEFSFQLPPTVAQSSLTELGLFTSTGDLRVMCTFPAVTLTPGLFLRVVVRVNYQ